MAVSSSWRPSPSPSASTLPLAPRLPLTFSSSESLSSMPASPSTMFACAKACASDGGSAASPPATSFCFLRSRSMRLFSRRSSRCLARNTLRLPSSRDRRPSAFAATSGVPRPLAESSRTRGAIDPSLAIASRLSATRASSESADAACCCAYSEPCVRSLTSGAMPPTSAIAVDTFGFA